MKKTAIAAALAALALTSTAMASETVPFCPAWWNSFNMNGDSILEVWGVPEANGKSFKANPDYGYPVPLAIAAWYTSLTNARMWNHQFEGDPNTKQRCFVIYYDPTPDGGGHYKIWSLSDRMQ